MKENLYAFAIVNTLLKLVLLRFFVHLLNYEPVNRSGGTFIVRRVVFALLRLSCNLAFVFFLVYELFYINAVLTIELAKMKKDFKAVRSIGDLETSS